MFYISYLVGDDWGPYNSTGAGHSINAVAWLWYLGHILKPTLVNLVKNKPSPPPLLELTTPNSPQCILHQSSNPNRTPWHEPLSQSNITGHHFHSLLTIFWQNHPKGLNMLSAHPWSPLLKMIKSLMAPWFSNHIRTGSTRKSSSIINAHLFSSSTSCLFRAHLQIAGKVATDPQLLQKALENL